MLKYKNYYLYMIFTLLLSSCTFTSNQYSEWIGSKSFKKFEDLNENMWTLEIDNSKYELLAVSVSPEKSIFADREGRYILFDGWTIIEKGGFKGIDTKTLVTKEDDFISVSQNGAVKFRYKCRNWLKNADSGKNIFTQNCIGRYNVVNKIIVDDNGYISEINQGVTDNKNPWKLSKN